MVNGGLRMCDKDIISEYFELFHLDERASQKELEIAYDVITKDKLLSELGMYRNAFEYLMCNYYHCVDTKDKITEENAKEILDNEIKQAIKSTPNTVKNALQFATKMGLSIDESAKLIWSTQIINLPMFFKSISKRIRNFLWFKYITGEDIKQIIIESVLNPIHYTTTTFEFYNLESSVFSEDIKDFIYNIRYFYSKENNLCKTFDIKETSLGVNGFVILEEGLSNQFIDLIRNKAIQTNSILNLVTNAQNGEDDGIQPDDEKY